MQTFFLAGATTAEYTTLNAVMASGKPRGLFNVPTLSADGASIVVGPHSGLFPTDFYLKEDSTNYVSAPAFSNLPSSYTIAWIIDPAGFQQPQLVVVSGAYAQDNAQMASYLVLGWIYHPGSNLALASDMLIPSPQAWPEHVLTNMTGFNIADAFTASLVKQFGNLSNATATVSVNEFGTCTIASSGGTSATYYIDVPVSNGVLPANSLRVDLSLSSQASVTFVKRYDDGSTQSVSLIQEGSMTGLLARGQYQIPLIRYKPLPWATWVLRVQLTLGPGASATFTRLCATTAPVTGLVQN